MTFQEVLAQVIAWLQREQRVSYRALKRQFGLDDDYLEDLKIEIIRAKKLAVDEAGDILVWIGDQASAPLPTSAPVTDQGCAPLDYTPPHLTEKILATRHTLAGERKQVTVLFADTKDSTEIIKDLDPEAAQQLLDPALHAMMDAVHRFEGTVNQVLGDGIMALFGAPLAHEDHALRACYAALTMQTALREHTEAIRRAHGIEMRIQVGLNSGEVVVRAIGNDLHMDYSAVGQTYFAAGQPYDGIIVAVRRPPREIARRLLRILNSVTAEEIHYQVCHICRDIQEPHLVGRGVCCWATHTVGRITCSQNHAVLAGVYTF